MAKKTKTTHFDRKFTAMFYPITKSQKCVDHMLAVAQERAFCEEKAATRACVSMSPQAGGSRSSALGTGFLPSLLVARYIADSCRELVLVWSARSMRAWRCLRGSACRHSLRRATSGVPPMLACARTKLCLLRCVAVHFSTCSTGRLVCSGCQHDTVPCMLWERWGRRCRWGLLCLGRLDGS